MPIYSFAHPTEDNTVDVEAASIEEARLRAILRLELTGGDHPILFAIDGNDVPGDD